jgi:hypothetical protein
LTANPKNIHKIATIAVRSPKVLVLNTDRNIAKVLTSIIGPKTRNAIIDPNENVDASERAKKASTDEQIEIINAKNIIAIIDSDGSEANTDMNSLGTTIWKVAANKHPITSILNTLKNSSLNISRKLL